MNLVGAYDRKDAPDIKVVLYLAPSFIFAAEIMAIDSVVNFDWSLCFYPINCPQSPDFIGCPHSRYCGVSGGIVRSRFIEINGYVSHARCNPWPTHHLRLVSRLAGWGAMRTGFVERRRRTLRERLPRIFHGSGCHVLPAFPGVCRINLAISPRAQARRVRIISGLVRIGNGGRCRD